MKRKHLVVLTLTAIVAGATALACSSDKSVRADSASGGAFATTRLRGAGSAMPTRLPSPATDAVASSSEASAGFLDDGKKAMELEAPSSEPAAQTPMPGRPSQSEQTIASTMLIRQGTASVQVDSLDLGISRVRDIARRVGGVVANTVVQTGRNELHSASIELRLPSDRFDEAVTGLSPIGKLETVNVSVEDVGEEFVDVTARVANARRLEERLIDLLARRTGKLSDVLAVERELARVREAIERYEGRLRYLRTRASVSTLTVTVHEPPPIVAEPGQSPIRDALKQAWRNFVDVVAVTIASMGVLIPLGVLLGGLVWLGRKHLPWSDKSRGAPAT